MLENIYPEQAPLCQDFTSEGFGLLCCERGPTCSYLVLSRAYLDEREKRITGNKDPIIPGFYNYAGIIALLEQNSDIASELIDGKTGVVIIDARGVKATNEDAGYAAGDNLLRTAGIRLLNQQLRTEAEPVLDELRDDWDPTQKDIGFRVNGKSDELLGLLRNITPDELSRIAGRIEQRFSVQQAMADSRRGLIPIPATVTYVHAADIQGFSDNALSTFNELSRMALDQLEPKKSLQYAEMLHYVRSMRQNKGFHVPNDQRLIYSHFISTLEALSSH